MRNTYLLLGKYGQLGWELHRALLPLGDVVALDFPELDFSNLDQLRQQVLQVNPQVIINAVAYTDVDQAEKQPEIAMQVNGIAPAFLAKLSAEIGAVFIHYSTDFVFDGLKTTPYTEADPINPLNAYARTKLYGDQAVAAVDDRYFVLRTSWLYSNRRTNFVKKVLSWAHSRTELSVVTDQIGSPTWARPLAEATVQMLSQGNRHLSDWAREVRGVYHLGGSGCVSRYDWAKEILRLDPDAANQTVRDIQPALSDDFPTPVKRPLFSALDCTRFYDTFGLRLPDWQIALELALQAN